MSELTAEQAIALLGLSPHPEGGCFRETFRDPAPPGTRAATTAIYYLLRAGEASRWHRVDAAEIWHWYAGSPMQLSVSPEGRGALKFRLGNDLARGERPQAAVPKGAWQSAKSLGNWTLVGCTVAPAFEFSGFELAPEGWQPG